MFFFFFFFNDTATTEIYTLSLHDALPIFPRAEAEVHVGDLIQVAIFPKDKDHGCDTTVVELGIHERDGERSEEHTSELQSQSNLVCRLLLEKKKKIETSSRCIDDTESVQQ